MKMPGPNKLYWLRCVIALWLLLASGTGLSSVPGEYDVKIVYLYNFTKFVNWPDTAFENADSALHICIMGDLPSTQPVQALQDKTSRNRDIVVRLLARQTPDADCHILFFTKTVSYAIVRKIIREMQSPTLIVGETPGFAKNEGTIGFVLDDRRRVRIEVNMDNAKSRDISIRAQLLEIARKVYRDQEGT